MDLRKSRFILLVYLFIIPFTSYAGDFDGSNLLSGTVEKVLEITQFKVNEDVDPDIVGLPRNFFIDIEGKTVVPSQESMIRTISKIKLIEHVENKIIFQGTDEGVDNIDDALAWSIAISKKTGKVVLSASGDGVAYVVFGSCTVVY